jgi:PHP domain
VPSAGPARRPRPGRARLLAAAGLAVLVAAAYGATARLGPIPSPPGWPPPVAADEYAAALHVHSRYSHDGRGTVEEIAAAAGRTGVRVVFLTDHSTLAPLGDGQEGWHGPTLVLVGSEVTTDTGYLLVLDPRPGTPVESRGIPFPEAFERYREDGAIVILAHPDHPRLGWRQAVLPPVDGIEVVDVFDQVVAAPLPRQLMGLIAYPANPVMAVLSVVHWPRGVLQSWDRMAHERPTIGVLGLDAHGGIALTEETGVRFPSHETAFGLGRLHFVAGEPLEQDEADRTRVYRALRGGRFYNAFDGLADPAGFGFEARRDGAVAHMGDTVEGGAGWQLEVRVPPVGETLIRVVRDGAVVREAPGPGPLRWPASVPGVYRVEVELGTNLFPITTARRMPWIFSNPIYVRP